MGKLAAPPCLVLGITSSWDMIRSWYAVDILCSRRNATCGRNGSSIFSSSKDQLYILDPRYWYAVDEEDDDDDDVDDDDGDDGDECLCAC